MSILSFIFNSKNPIYSSSYAVQTNANTPFQSFAWLSSKYFFSPLLQVSEADPATFRLQAEEAWY